MRSALPLIEGFILDRLLSSQTLLSRRSKVGLFLMGLATLCFLAAVVFFIVALSHWLNAHYEPDQASLFTAMAVLGLAIIFGAVSYGLLARKKTRLSSMHKDLTENLAAAFEMLTEELDDPIRSHPKTALAVAVAAGFLIADRML